MHKHLRLTCYALLCLLVPIGVMAQTEHTYLDRALPGSWSEEGSDFQQTLPVEDNWWRNFKDPLLDSLIEVAVKQNYSVQMAMDRIAMAKANLRSAQGSYSPTLGLSAGWTRQQSSGNINQVPKAITQYSSATVDMNWEVDVFGSIRNRVKAEKENFAASKEEYNAAMVSLCAQVASSYINMRELQQEVKVAQQNCRSQQTVVQITQKRYETGLVSKLDVAQAQSIYYSTKASLPMLEAGIIQYANSLAILLGLYPSDLQKIMETDASLPEYIEPVGVGLPANLLLRRPDVRAAERQVNALAASLRLAKAQLDESIRQFNQTVLTSVQEVDNAMSSYKNSIKQIVALREVVNQGKQTLDLSLDLYKQGLTPFQNVLDAQRSLLTYQNQLTQAQGSSLLNLIQLYQSLGGGWNPM